MIRKLSNLYAIVGFVSCAAMSHPGSVAQAKGGASTGGGDPRLQLPSYEYKCKAIYSTPAAASPFVENLVFNKDEAGKMVQRTGFRISLTPHWVDIDPVDFSPVGAFVSEVKIWVGGTRSFLSVPFELDKFSVTATSDLSDGSGRDAVTVSCRKTTPPQH